MDVTVARKRIFVSGQLLELWEHPEVSFGLTQEHLDSYVARGAWVLLFNAVVLTAARPAPAYES